MDMNLLRAAASQGFDQLTSLGKTQDDDLELYSTLKQEDFSKLVQKYGNDDVIKYIKTMEARRLKNAYRPKTTN